MAEIIYYYPSHRKIACDSADIRWLTVEDLDVFNKHLAECGQRTVDKELWDKIGQEGTVYCGLFIDGLMVARCCVEKYSKDKWEVADVRTVSAYRNRGCAMRVCVFVLNEILSYGKTPTIRTEESNHAMQKVIHKMCFVPL